MAIYDISDADMGLVKVVLRERALTAKPAPKALFEGVLKRLEPVRPEALRLVLDAMVAERDRG